MSAREDFRVVLMGRTGSGKSATGNMLLGQTAFQSKMAAGSVTQYCEIGETSLQDGRKLIIVDTPGFFDTHTPPDKLSQEISRCVSMSSPGPHAFLFVISPNRFTEEEVQTVELFFKVFGRSVEKYMIVVFTRADELEGRLDEFISSSDRLKSLMSQCGNRRLAVDNKSTSKRNTQLTQLIKSIDTMVRHNGGSCYTNAMYEENAKLIAEQERKIKKEFKEKQRQEHRRIEIEISRKYEKQLSAMTQNVERLNKILMQNERELQKAKASKDSMSPEVLRLREEMEKLDQERKQNQIWINEQMRRMQNEIENAKMEKLFNKMKVQDDTIAQLNETIKKMQEGKKCSIM